MLLKPPVKSHLSWEELGLEYLGIYDKSFKNENCMYNCTMYIQCIAGFTAKPITAPPPPSAEQLSSQ